MWWGLKHIAFAFIASDWPPGRKDNTTLKIYSSFHTVSNSIHLIMFLVFHLLYFLFLEAHNLSVIKKLRNTNSTRMITHVWVYKVQLATKVQTVKKNVYQILYIFIFDNLRLFHILSHSYTIFLKTAWDCWNYYDFILK